MRIRVCVCGGRNYSDKEKVYSTLDVVCADHFLKSMMVEITIVSGGATGADFLAVEWAKACGVPYEVHKANWKEFGKAAGPIRNQQMVDLGIDLLVAFPGGSGTKDMTERCRKKNIKICSVS